MFRSFRLTVDPLICCGVCIHHFTDIFFCKRLCFTNDFSQSNSLLSEAAQVSYTFFHFVVRGFARQLFFRVESNFRSKVPNSYHRVFFHQTGNYKFF